jgi:hypothetical protein
LAKISPDLIWLYHNHILNDLQENGLSIFLLPLFQEISALEVSFRHVSMQKIRTQGVIFGFGHSFADQFWT